MQKEKYIIMVDATYVSAAAATENKPDQSISKNTTHSYFGINPDYIVKNIIRKAAPFVNDSDRLLRVQWYDAIKEEDQQLKILSGVEHLRFCRCRQNLFGKIKGVLAQIIVDAMVMIQAKAIDTLVLVSGDENFYPLMEFAKNNGVKCVLIGIGESKARMSLALISEADAYDYIDTKDTGIQGKYGFKPAHHLPESSLRTINLPASFPSNNLVRPDTGLDLDISAVLPPIKDIPPQDLQPFVEEIIDDMNEEIRNDLLSGVRNTEEGQVVNIPQNIDRILILAVKYKIGRMLTIGEKHSVRDLAVQYGESMLDE